MNKLQKIVVTGQYSKKEMKIDVDVVYELINAYMTIIPNEKRELALALKVLRFHDDVRDMFTAEEKAGLEELERRTTQAIAEGL
jgi:hypothetical protein